MAVQGSTDTKRSLESTLNSIFDGPGWRRINAHDADSRSKQCADLFREITGARWGTHIRMLDNGRVRYFLLHLTKHDAGRDLMKECMWKACPDGGFYASKADNPKQVVLIQPEPDLKSLHDLVVKKLAAGPKRWKDLTHELREEFWLGKHLTETLRRMRTNGEIKAEGKFVQTENPLLRLDTM
jgi:hypothetical protein